MRAWSVLGWVGVALLVVLVVGRQYGWLFNSAGATVRVPSRVTLPDGSRLQLAFLSNEDIRTLIQEANAGDGTVEPVWNPPRDFVQLFEGYRKLPWRMLDVDVALHRIRKQRLSTSGWMSVPRVVDNPKLNEGEHIPRYVTEADVKVLRRGNGCGDEDAKCGQYKLNVSTGEPEVHQLSTREMLRKT